jgi:hypothetical protein
MATRQGPSRLPWLVAGAVGGPIAAAAWAGVGVVEACRNAVVGAAIVAACALAGAPAVRWLALRHSGAMERLLLALAAGTGLVGLVLLGLGAAGWLAPPVVLATVCVLAASGAMAARPARVAAASARELARALRGVDGAVLAAAGVLAWSALVAVSAAPVLDWDSLMYHLRVPRQFLETGRVFLPPDNPHVAHVGPVHMLYVLARAAGAPQAAVAISGLFALALGAAVLCAAARGARGAGRLAAAGVIGCTVIAHVALTPRVDATLALFLVLAHAAVVRVASGASPRLLLGAGIMAGCAAAIKVHALAYLAPVGVLALWSVRGRRGAARAVGAAAALAVLLAAPWLLKNWALLGDPLSPLLAGEPLPAWLAADERVRAVAPAVDRGVVGRAREPFTLARLVLAPGSLSPEPEARGYLWSPLLLAGLWAAVASRRAILWAAPALAYVAVILVRSPQTNLRYLIAALPALSVAAALGFAFLARRWRVLRPALPAFAVASALPFARPLSTVLEDVRCALRDDDILEIAAAAKRRVAEGGRILMLYDARGLPFERTVYQDNAAIAWPLLARSGHAEECLRSFAFSHVLLSKGPVLFYLSRGSAIPEVTDGGLQRFIRACLEVEEEVGGLTLYRIRPPSR